MAHRLYDGARTMLIVGDAMAAGRAQTRRMLQGAAALRAATHNLTVAIERREAALDRRDAARERLAVANDRLAKARAARAARG